MTKNILLISAGIFILALLGLWTYLLFFGSPTTTDQVFVDLGLKNPTTERPALITDINKSNSEALSFEGALNQLTVRPVAGYVITTRPTDKIRYAERGTGHIYEINFTTKIETRIVGTTIGKTTAAYFSPDGLLAVLVSETESGTAATMITIPEVTGDTSVTTDLPDNIREIEVVSSTTVNYLQTVNGAGVAYRFNRISGTASELWRTPLTDIKVWWGNSKTYVVNKTAPYLKGAVYEVAGKAELVPITEPAFAYTAFKNNISGDIVETKFDSESNKLVSEKISATASQKIATLALPEKCTFHPNKSDELWCGAAIPDSKNLQRDFIKDWYMGLVTSKDSLWASDFRQQSSSMKANLSALSGLTIDLVEPKFNQDGSRLFFQNKLDGTLWLYQVTAPTPAANQIDSAPIPLNNP